LIATHNGVCRPDPSLCPVRLGTADIRRHPQHMKLAKCRVFVWQPCLFVWQPWLACRRSAGRGPMCPFPSCFQGWAGVRFFPGLMFQVVETVPNVVLCVILNELKPLTKIRKTLRNFIPVFPPSPSRTNPTCRRRRRALVVLERFRDAVEADALARRARANVLGGHRIQHLDTPPVHPLASLADVGPSALKWPLKACHVWGWLGSTGEWGLGF
jgi:hypothetical protein